MGGNATKTARRAGYYHAEGRNCPNPFAERRLAAGRHAANLPGLRVALGGSFPGTECRFHQPRSRRSDASVENGRRPDEADLPAESYSSETKSRVSRENEHSRWPGHLEAAPGEGPEAPRSRDSLEVNVTGRTGRFQRADRLLSSQEFRRVGRHGERLATRYFVVLVTGTEMPEEKDRRRLGVTVSRRVGNAVVRNRIKRGVREWFRRSREQLDSPIDLVVIARSPASSLSGREISETLDEMLFSGRSSST